jgi:Transposase IS66 family
MVHCTNETVVGKYCNHIPLHRQSVILERDIGLEISRATLDGWVLKVGELLILIFPFETAWMLHVGDQAPDFSLIKLDKSERLQLSVLSQQQPVVLVFGSYT